MQRIKKRIYNYLLPIKKEKEINRCYITCMGRNDGLGAQLLSIFSVMLVAKQYNITYVHTPFEFLLHSEGEESFLEDFFALSEKELLIDNLSQSNLKIKTIKHPYEIKKKEGLLYKTQSCHQYSDKFPDNYLNITKEIKNKFFYKFEENYKNYNVNDYLNIGLHIRRGDVSKDTNEIRFTNNSFYINILDSILKLIINKGININIHIYSQGNIDDFKEFEKYDNIFFHLDECLLTTFYNLIESDILLMSKSTLSYCAGLFNDKVVLYEPFWHSPLSKWNIIENGNLTLDDDKLSNQIQKLVHKKVLIK